MAFNYAELDSLVEKYYLPVLVDQIYNSDPILAKLKEGKKTVNGGRAFKVVIKTDNLNHGVYGADTTFNIAKKQITDAVDLPVRGHYSSLTSDGFDEAIAEGDTSFKSLLSEKMKDMEEALRIELLEKLYKDPAVVDVANKGFIGLTSIIDDNNTYAGLDRTNAAYKYWKSVVKEDGVAGVDITGDAGYQLLRTHFMKVTNGGQEGKGLIWVGDFSTVNKIEFMLAQKNLTSSNDKESNLGFESFKLFNRAVYAAPELEAIAETTGKGILYALNFDYLTMYTMKQNDFAMTPWKVGQDNDLRVKQLKVEGNFVCTKPSRQGVIRDIII